LNIVNTVYLFGSIAKNMNRKDSDIDIAVLFSKGLDMFERFDYKMISVTREDTERLMGDHKVNAAGYQQKDFSRIRSDFSHEELMKEKDAEIEKAKKKGRDNVGGG
jgi:predicted nucleotidyltransferase